MNNWKLVCACLHYRGIASDLVSNDDHIKARKLADGFGPGQVPENDCFWDWSHVRDSSEEAVEAIAASLRGSVNEQRVASVIEVNGGELLKPWRV